MADFIDFIDASGGGGIDGDGGEADIAALLAEGAGDANKTQRDVCIVVIDCSASMHEVPPLPTEPTDSEEPPTQPLTAFQNAVRCALEFYQQKVVTSENDLVGCVLYNSRESLNVFGFPHLYVFHELEQVAVNRLQELQNLARVSTPGGSEWQAEYMAKIGFRTAAAAAGGAGPTPTPLGGQSPAADASAAAAKGNNNFSETLWAIQHMLHHTPKNVAFKRAFVFTDAEDPTAGDAVESNRCFARMRDLREAGVIVNVFGHGWDSTPASMVTGTGHSSGPFTGSGSPPPLGGLLGNIGTAGGYVLGGTTAGPTPMTLSPPRGPPTSSEHGSGSGIAPYSATGVSSSHGGGGGASKKTRPAHLRPFDRQKFWERLLHAPSSKKDSLAGGGAFDPMAAVFGAVEPPDADGNDDYAGSVAVSDASFDFEMFRERFLSRLVPRRSTGSLTLSFAMANDSGVAPPSPAKTAGADPTPIGGVSSASPQMGVKVFVPIMKCAKPKFHWLDSETNAMTTTESRKILRTTGAEVSDVDIINTVAVGGAEVEFTRDEVKNMKSQLGTPGLKILGFKDKTDTLKAKMSIARSCFIHPLDDEQGGPQAMNNIKLFVQLHRTCTAKNRVAVAELIPRPGAPPRIVALVPSDLSKRRGDDDIDPFIDVTGCGFHIIPLPYAEDYRSLTFQPPTKIPAPDLIGKAKTIIQKLSVDFDACMVPNPVLQHQYNVLQQLALMEMDESRAVIDETLPDTQHMVEYHKGSLNNFTSGVFPAGYLPEIVCPAAKPAKPPPSKDDMALIDFDGLEKVGKLSTLTIPYLKAYLKLKGEDVAQGKLKADLVEQVASTIRKERGVKRAREDDEGRVKDEDD